MIDSGKTKIPFKQRAVYGKYNYYNYVVKKTLNALVKEHFSMYRNIQIKYLLFDTTTDKENISKRGRCSYFGFKDGKHIFLLSFNIQKLKSDFYMFKKVTIKHELAHAMGYVDSGFKEMSHGIFWRNAMKRLNVESKYITSTRLHDSMYGKMYICEACSTANIAKTVCKECRTPLI